MLKQCPKICVAGVKRTHQKLYNFHLQTSVLIGVHEHETRVLGPTP